MAKSEIRYGVVKVATLNDLMIHLSGNTKGNIAYYTSNEPVKVYDGEETKQYLLLKTTQGELDIKIYNALLIE